MLITYTSISIKVFLIGYDSGNNKLIIIHTPKTSVV